MLRYDPMSMRPFMSYGEGDYAAHWLEVFSRLTTQPIFAHVNWFQRGDDGRFLWPGYRENLRPLVWLMQYKNGEVSGVETPVGVIPARDELLLEGLDDIGLTLRQVEAITEYEKSRPSYKPLTLPARIETPAES